MDHPKFRNPNIALLERRRALRTLHAFDVADAARAGKAETQPRVEAQSEDEPIGDFRQTIFRRLRT